MSASALGDLPSEKVEEIQRAVDRAHDLRALVLGDLMLDVYVFGSVERTSPEAPVPVVRTQRIERKPGGAANAALNLASLGVRTTLVGVVGDDRPATHLLAALERDGVAVRAVEDASRPTTVKTRILASDTQVVRVDREDCDALSDDCASSVAAHARRALEEGVDVVVLSDYAKGVITATVASEVVGASRARGVPVVVDPKGRDYGRYDGALVLTPNLSELHVASGADPATLGVESAVRTLGPRLPDVAFLVTKGAEGMELFDGDCHVDIPAHPADAFDVTGAGDTVAATLALGVAAGLPLTLAAHLANLAAGAVVRKLGAAQLGNGDLRALLDAAVPHALRRPVPAPGPYRSSAV